MWAASRSLRFALSIHGVCDRRSGELLLPTLGQRVVRGNAMRNNTPLAGHLLNPGNDGSVEIVALVLVLDNRKRQVCEPGSGTIPAPCLKIGDKPPPTAPWTRVFKPGHEILAQ